MNRSTTNFLVDLAVFAVFLMLVSTGILMYWVLPSGSGHFATVLGLTRHDWGVVHFWLAVTMVLLIAVHLLLHWRWIVSMARGKPSQPSRLRVVATLSIVAGVVLLATIPFLNPVVEVASPGGSQRAHAAASESLQIEGSMTLRQAAEQGEIDPETLRVALGLPEDVSVDERLGRLRRQYDFELDAVRAIMVK